MMTTKNDLIKEFKRNNVICFFIAVLAAVLSAIINLMVSWLVKKIVDSISISDFAALKICISFAGIILLLCALDSIVICIMKPRYIKRAITNYKNCIFEKLTLKKLFAFDSEDSNDFLSGFTNDVVMIEKKYLELQTNLIMDTILFFGALIMMIILSAYLTAIGVVLFITPMMVSGIVGKKLQEADIKVSSRNAEFTSFIKDCLLGFDLIKSFYAEEGFIRRFQSKNTLLEDTKEKSRMIQLIVGSISSFGGIIAQMGLFFVGAYFAYVNENITAGTVIAVVQLMNFIIIPLSEIPELVSNREASKALIDKMAKRLSDDSYGQMLYSEAIKKRVSLLHVGYKISNEKMVLNDVNVDFEMGKSYAIIGESGSGKSTLLKILTGTIKDISGDIYIDGKKLCVQDGVNITNHISYAQQKAFIFNASIKDNVTLFHDIEDTKLIGAIEQSCLSELINEKGWDYNCGEDGINLSGGEKQRISVARCFVRDSDIILADEITSSLDKQASDKIYDFILKCNRKLRIVVTHRNDSELLKRFDRVIVMKDGCIIANENYETLKSKLVDYSFS